MVLDRDPPMATSSVGVTGRGGKSYRCLVGSTQGGMRETSKGGVIPEHPQVTTSGLADIPQDKTHKDA